MFRSNVLLITAAMVLKRICFSSNTGSIKFNQEVRLALKEKKPVVALESSIITHGMPYPDNLNTAMEVESIVRRNEAVPATIAVFNGKIQVGLDKQQLNSLAQDKEAAKISKRDMSVAMAKKLSGGTTVAATILIANMAGITVFVTGGIGGVHRGAHTSMDISNDLIEIARTPIAVVSSGVKSILDIEKTLQFLETQGVCVLSYGPSKQFPAFFTVKSGVEAPHNVETVHAAADVISKWIEFGGNSGILIAVPLPEDQAVDETTIEAAICKADVEAKQLKITGNYVTPFLLARVNQLTQGKSLKANIALIKNNAHIGSQIAVKLAAGCQQSRNLSYARPVVIGGSNADLIVKVKRDDVEVPNLACCSCREMLAKQTGCSIIH